MIADKDTTGGRTGDRSCRFVAHLVVLTFLIVPLTAFPQAKPKPGSTRRTAATSAKDAADGAPELTAKASEAIAKGLKYLLSVQQKDGSFVHTPPKRGGKASGPKYAVGISSLGLMAFMANGHFPGSGPYGKQLEMAKDNLLKYAKQRKDGYLGATMYEHGLATLALSEMWGMTRKKSDDDDIQKALEAAVDVILRAQSPDAGGWNYQPGDQSARDTSTTVMTFVALASARQAGIMVPEITIKRVIKYLKMAYVPDTGGFPYRPSGANRSPSFACSAGGAYIAQLVGLRGTEMVDSTIRFIKSKGAAKSGGHFYYAHYYAIQAMVQAGDKEYGKWYPKIRDALITNQKKDGSWGVGHETSMAIIILSTPHRYIPIYQR